MSVTPVFSGRVTDRCSLVPDDAHRFTTYISTLSGQRVEIVVRKQRSQRSLRENAYYWGVVVASLAEYCGYTPDELHEALKWKFLREPEDMTAAHGLAKAKSSAALTVPEFEDYLERVRRWAAMELNVVLPLPNEADFAPEGS